MIDIWREISRHSAPCFFTRQNYWCAMKKAAWRANGDSWEVPSLLAFGAIQDFPLCQTSCRVYAYHFGGREKISLKTSRRCRKKCCPQFGGLTFMTVTDPLRGQQESLRSSKPVVIHKFYGGPFACFAFLTLCVPLDWAEYVTVDRIPTLHRLAQLEDNEEKLKFQIGRAPIRKLDCHLLIAV